MGHSEASTIEKATIERRFTPATELRVVQEDGKPTKIVGYAAVFNSKSVDLGGFQEVIAPGAFTDALEKEHDVRALFNHDPNLVLGRSTAGTLRLKQDATGLWSETDLPDTQLGRDLAVSMERGDVDQMSFAFNLEEGGDLWDTDDEDMAQRVITRVANLYDVSPVTYPAYPDTSVALRSLGVLRGEKVTPPDDAADEDAAGAEDAETRASYDCECIECGHTLTSEEHCRDIACPECGGEMRRKERPGVGRDATPADEGSSAAAAEVSEDAPDWGARLGALDAWKKTDKRRALYEGIARRRDDA